MIYENEKTAQISFPLGGIGAGCVGLGGNGRLIDWEIFNRPNKGSLNCMSHFAVKAEKEGKVIDARILHGDLQPPYTGNYKDTRTNFEGFGWGPSRDTLCGMPHFRHCSFNGEYPVAWLDFTDPRFPANAQLCAWSPFIPGNDRESGIPAACFEITIVNTSDDTLDYSVVGALTNPFKTPTASNRYANGQLVLSHGGNTEELEYGDLCLTTDAESISYQEYWFHGGWCDDLEVYWHDLTAPGKFHNRHYEPGHGERNSGLIAAHFRLSPGETHTVNFIISWHVPNCTNDWNEHADKLAAENGLKNRWKNYYATQWADSSESGRYLSDNYRRIRQQTMLFHDTLFSSSLPETVLDGISANLSILKSPTCLRLEDGTFYGWEGVGSHAGSCEGSCTHVWNYAQALPFLFPELERSMRAAHYRYSVDAHGGNRFRLMLPLGIKAVPEHHRPCVDGQFGDVMKAWRDWKVSGNTAWMKEQWPSIKYSIQYAWSGKNHDRWDPGKTGVITGRQHHTLDMELFGASAWLNGHYLGALKAAAEMADRVGEPEFAAECRAIFAKGKAWTDEHLFNGEYYGQQVDLKDREMLKQFRNGEDIAEKTYWDEEHGEIKYQIGGGCEIDMHLPQWYASLYGLGEILDPGKTRETLKAIFKYNFKDSMRDIANQWRNYCINDESGTLMCTWPNPRNKPIIPLPYSSETMHGFEWALASHLIMNGMVAEGMRVVGSIRARYDGKKRNPWNEFECGSNYARSMASYALLHAFSGFTFDATTGFLGFAPVAAGKFNCFWSLGHAWGEYARSADKETLSVKYGSFNLCRLRLSAVPRTLEYRNQPVPFSVADDGSIVLLNTITLEPGSELSARY